MAVEIPRGVNLEVKGSSVAVSGKMGKLERTFPTKNVSLSKTDKGFEAKAAPALANTIESHVRNMIKGVSVGYSLKLQTVYSHFPLSIEIKGSKMLVKNFLGEKQPRIVDIVGATKIEAKPPAVAISGPCKEDVGQTVSNIFSALKITKRDSRVFQDGIYIVEE